MSNNENVIVKIGNISEENIDEENIDEENIDEENIDEENIVDINNIGSETLIEKYNKIKLWLTQNVHKTVSAKHVEFTNMCDMLKNHPNYNSWVHKDPQGFKITRSKKNKALQVHVKLNGKWRIVSWVACAKGRVIRKPNEANQMTQAMRFSIRKQIKMWRNAIGNSHNPKCTLCNCNVKNSLEVDHFPEKFCSLRDSFLKTINETPSIYWDKKNTTYRFSKNESVNTKWQKYHLKHASYRWLCGDCNKKTNK